MSKLQKNEAKNVAADKNSIAVGNRVVAEAVSDSWKVAKSTFIAANCLSPVDVTVSSPISVVIA